MDQIKEAFSKVRGDINSLKSALEILGEELIKIKEEIKNLNENSRNFLKNQGDFIPTHNLNIPTNQQIIPTNLTHLPTDTFLLKPLKAQNKNVSIGNDGVPTDRQTNQQTDRQTQNSMKNALEALNSLDGFKKEIRLKFKRLTEQEMLIFSMIYQFDEESGSSDYRVLAERLNLTESPIRDYVGKLIKKGIPVEKTKINNKSVQLNISKNLKNIAPLSTILALREI